MELTINIQDTSKLQPLIALLNSFTAEQKVSLTVQYARNDALLLPVSDSERAAAWLNLQGIVSRNKLRQGEAVMSAEDEEALILQEIKTARSEERAQV